MINCIIQTKKQKQQKQMFPQLLWPLDSLADLCFVFSCCPPLPGLFALHQVWGLWMSMGHTGAKMQPSGATSSPHTLNWWSSGNDFKLGWNIIKTTMPAIQNDSNLTQTHDDQCPPRFSMADPPLNFVITAPRPGSWSVCRPSIWKTTIWI